MHTALFLSDVRVDMNVARRDLNRTRPFSAAVRNLHEVLADAQRDVRGRAPEKPSINVDLAPAGRRRHADPGFGRGNDRPRLRLRRLFRLNRKCG